MRACGPARWYLPAGILPFCVFFSTKLSKPWVPGTSPPRTHDLFQPEQRSAPPPPMMHALDE